MSAQRSVNPRAELANVPIYDPALDPAALDLSDNTNRWGAPPVASSIASDAAGSLTRYPSAYSTELVAAIAEQLDADRSMIVTGCGSDDVLDAAIRAYGAQGGVLAHIEPTFAMIPAFARANGLQPRAVGLTTAYDTNAAAMIAGASVVYLCSPNNPTGTIIPRETIEQIVREAEGLVILDEAYVDFTGESLVDLVRSSSRLLVTRTFSKAFGLAGLRVGYGVGSPSIIEAVKRARGPYKVSAAAERVAVAALRHDRAWVADRARDATQMRELLFNGLRDLGLEPIPSRANFVLVPVHDANRVSDAMRACGVIVRAFSALTAVSPALAATGGDALRITVGPVSEMDRVLTILREAMIACA